MNFDKETLNPNAAAFQLKEMLSKLGATAERLKDLSDVADQYTTEKEMIFILHGKEGKITLAKNKSISIFLPNADKADIEEITRRLLLK